MSIYKKISPYILAFLSLGGVFLVISLLIPSGGLLEHFTESLCWLSFAGASLLTALAASHWLGSRIRRPDIRSPFLPTKLILAGGFLGVVIFVGTLATSESTDMFEKAHMLLMAVLACLLFWPVAFYIKGVQSPRSEKQEE